jgi:hypothetical protein
LKPFGGEAVVGLVEFDSGRAKLESVSGGEDGTGAAERVEDSVTWAGGTPEKIVEEGNRLLSLVAEVVVRGAGDNIPTEPQAFTIPLHRVEDGLILSLRAMLRPGRAIGRRLEPNERGAEYSPTCISK